MERWGSLIKKFPRNFESTDPNYAISYWLTRPPVERLQALELLRRTFYGDTSATERLQRVLEVAQLKPR
ncbi:MAG: hypothetical protein NTV52_26745 [Acidobacteria bacterium]|nr:hypothetical protein [Acidobacteriota bacterium]